MGKGTNTTTQNTTTAPSAQAGAAYSNVLQQAQGVAATPYTPYTGELVAPFNQEQNQGVAGVNQYANSAQPAINTAINQTQANSQPLTQQQIQQYQSPYTQDVVNATQQQFNNQNQQQQQGVVGNAIAQGALGGNRSAIAQAETANQEQLAQAPVIAGLENQGYQTGLSTAEQQQGVGLAGAAQTGNLGVAGQTAGLTGAGTQLTAGAQQQATQQALDTAQQTQFQNQQAYPFQEAQWLAGIDTGVGSQMGGTSSGQTTAPAPSLLGQLLGATTAGVGVIGGTGGFGSSGWLSQLARGGVAELEETVKRARGGVAALEEIIHRAKGGAINGVAGFAHGGVPSFADGGWTSGVAGVPFAGAHGYIPTNSITHGSGPPPQHAPAAYQVPANDMAKQASSLGGLAKNITDGINGKNPLPAGSAIPGAQGPTSVGGPNGMPTPLVNPDGSAIASSAPDPSAGVMNFNSGDQIYARGGAVKGIAGFADGGVPLPTPDPREGSANVRGSYNDLRSTPPVTVMEDLVGRLSQSKGQNNAVRDAIRQRAMDTIKKYPDVSDPAAAYRANRYAFGGVAGFDTGGVPTADDPPADPNTVINPDDPVRMPGDDAMQAWRDGVDHPNAAIKADDTKDLPPPKVNGIAPASDTTSFAADDSNKATSKLPPEVALGYSGNDIAPVSVRDANEHDKSLYSKDSTPKPQSNGVDLGADGKLWPSLMSAGFGMMASRSPFVGNAIGEGGMAGLNTYSAESKQQQEAQQHADALELERQRLQQTYQAEQATERNQAVILGSDGKPMVNPAAVAAKQATEKDYQPKVITSVNPITGESEYLSYDPNKKTLTRLNPSGAPVAKPTPAPDIDTVKTVESSGMTGLNKQQTAAPYNYAVHAPTIEKGMDVPEPDLSYIPRASTASLKADAATYLQTGKLPSAPVSRGTPLAVAAVNYRAAVQNYGNAVAQSRGFLPDQLATMWRMAPDLPKWVMGAPGQSTVSLGVAMSHLDTLRQYIDAAKFPDTPRFKQLQAAVSREFGASAATNVDAAASVVGPEIVKAIGIAGAGTADERDHAANMFKGGAKQATDAIGVVQHLMAGQLEGKERQAKAVGMPDEMFRNLVGSRAYDLLKNLDQAGSSGTLALADKQALDWANANPNDPRAGAIKKKLGIQ